VGDFPSMKTHLGESVCVFACVLITWMAINHFLEHLSAEKNDMHVGPRNEFLFGGDNPKLKLSDGRGNHSGESPYENI